MNLTERTRDSWDNHYKKDKSIQRYPDENLVRLIPYAEAYGSGSDSENLRALDLGCGSGRHLKLLSEKGYSRIWGMDISENSVEICRNLYPFAEVSQLKIPENLKSQHGRETAAGILPFPDHFFSLIIMWGVLHYNEEYLRNILLSEIRRVAVPGALFLGTVRSTNDTHYRNNADINSAPVFYFTESEITEMLSPWCVSSELGYAERSPVGRLQERVAHWIFRAVL